jgi:hypothetical protein
VRPTALRPLLVLAIAVAPATGCEQACPAALLTGVLSEQAGELVVIPEGGGPVERVNWPFGYVLHEDGGTLVVTDLVGTVKAREKDTVRLGGGEARSGVWNVCGTFEVEPASANR